MGFWEKVKAIFIKQKEAEPEQEQQELLYSGYYPTCWACEKMITDGKIKKLNGKKTHTRCFRQLKKIALNGSSIENFTG